ncbi:MAG TPA: cysteine desulfurase family protein [Dermatophilaceae bacterium]|jgi:cysteine desulfurase
MIESFVYLDHGATTPMLPEAIEAMTAQMAMVGNASSLHTSGRLGRRVVEESRESIAQDLGARPSEVVFTSGGTEADNLAIKGTFWARRDADPRRVRILVSTVEHHAVIDCVEFLEAHEGAKVTWLEVDQRGRVAPETVRAAIGTDPETVALVSVMWANNEVGTVQPIAEIAAVAREFAIPTHSDAVQAVGQLEVSFAASGLDLMSVSGHKIGGPLGVGALLVRRDATLVPLTHGGGQERQVRSGSLDVPAIRGFAVALRHCAANRAAATERMIALRDRLIRGAQQAGFGVQVTGVWEPGDGTGRLPGNAHLLVPGCDGDSLLYLLDAAGVQCSTGSACQAGVPQPSHVLLAMGMSEHVARGALRLTLGHSSTAADVDAFLAALPAAVERAQRAQMATSPRQTSLKPTG